MCRCPAGSRWTAQHPPEPDLIARSSGLYSTRPGRADIVSLSEGPCHTQTPSAPPTCLPRTRSERSS
eukprot:1377918-Rhodomonas_salina.1